MRFFGSASERHACQFLYVFEYFEIFNKIPIENNKNISDDPPALINGSALPVGGIDEVATATCIKN